MTYEVASRARALDAKRKTQANQQSDAVFSIPMTPWPARAPRIPPPPTLEAPMTRDELNAALAASASPDRVTPEYIESRILHTDFVPNGMIRSHNGAGSTLTLCVITLDNGFQVTGESACAVPENYREDIGEKIAYDNAFAKLWPLFGFLLKEALHIKQKA